LSAEVSAYGLDNAGIKFASSNTEREEILLASQIYYLNNS